MKHLKTYKIFESNSEHDDIIGVLNDMSLELKDDGFLVKNNVGVFNNNLINVKVYKANDDADITTGGSKRFLFEEIKETILQMVDFMNSEGWSMKEIVFSNSKGIHVSYELCSGKRNMGPFIIRFEKR